MAAGHSVDPDRWLAEADELLGRAGRHVGRVEPRKRLRRFVFAMMAPLPRVNCWSIAEYAGEASPRAMQRLLSSAAWDQDAVLGEVRDWVIERLGAPDATLVIDETGDQKKGTATVGTQRQYSGTTARIENCQVAVYLAYTTDQGHSLLDRCLYLPKSWTSDPQRLEAAGVPNGVAFATKPALARELIERTLDAGVPACSVTGDEVYGNDPKLRKALHQRAITYVLAVAKTHEITTGIGPRKAVELAVRLKPAAWKRLSAGKGAKGERWYDWAVIDTIDPAAGPGGHHMLLIRRNIKTGEYAFYRAWSPQSVPVRTLVKIAGRRWSIEESFASGKELAALDEHQVRTWTSWNRWTALAILAHALLSVLAATEPPPAPASGLIRLTRNEIRRLLAHVLQPVHDVLHALHWSTWRRTT
ncbi:IS701 family transposase, partial [Kineosporia babensis]